MADTEPFFIEFSYNNKPELAEVKPCCQKDNVYYYDISIQNKYQFTVTPGSNGKEQAWRVSLKNADKQVDEELVEIIGEEIEKRMM
jgi:hypothetical protein